MIDNSGINRTGIGRSTGFERDSTTGEGDEANVDAGRPDALNGSGMPLSLPRFRPASPVRRQGEEAQTGRPDAEGDLPLEDLPPSIVMALGREYIDRRASAGTLSPRQAAELRRDPELMLHVGTTLGDGSDPSGLRTVDALIVADDAAAEATSGASATSEPEPADGADGVAESAGEVPADETAPADGVSADAAPESAPDDALVRQGYLERGGEYVGSLLESGALTSTRAVEILADPDLLVLIGTLAGDRTDPIGVRAAEVLITDVGTSIGAADRHLSELVRSGALDPAAFRTLANDGEFIDDLVASLGVTPDGAPPAPSAATERLLDQALANLGAGRAPTAGADEPFVSRDGLPFVRNGERLDADGASGFVYVTAGGRPFPEEIQRALDATGGSGDDIAGPLLRGAKVLAGVGDVTPAERLVAFAHEHGLSDLDTYLDQLDRIDDGSLLDGAIADRAAGVLFGAGPEAPTPAERTLGILFKGGHIDLATFAEQVGNPVLHPDDSADGGSLAYRTENLKPGGDPDPEPAPTVSALSPTRRETLADEALDTGLFATDRQAFDRTLFTSGLERFAGLDEEDRERLLGTVDARLADAPFTAVERERSHAAG